MKFFRSFVRIWLPALAISFAVASFGQAEGPVAAKVDTAWDDLFTRSNGWTGGDVAGTIDLKDGRILWVFGDSWIGKVKDGKHVGGSHMVNNTAAIHTRDASNPTKPPQTIQFLWGPNGADGKPTAWVVPDENSSDKSEKSWFWTSGGGTVVQHADRTALYVNLFRVQKRGDGGGVWNFRTIGTTMAVFDDISQPVAKWRARLVDIPFSMDPAKGGDGAKGKVQTWGVTILNEPSPAGDELMIYGVRSESHGHDTLVLAKVNARDVEKFDQWRFYVEPNRWSENRDEAQPVAPNVPSELTVEKWGKSSKYVMVHSELFFGKGIFVRTADRPEGPWSSPKLVHHVTDKEGDKRFFTYAAKGHADLSDSDELLITYLVNSHDFKLMFQDASIYKPRFVRAKLSP